MKLSNFKRARKTQPVTSAQKCTSDGKAVMRSDDIVKGEDPIMQTGVTKQSLDGINKSEMPYESFILFLPEVF